jgi:hypothetical protein
MPLPFQNTSPKSSNTTSSTKPLCNKLQQMHDYVLPTAKPRHKRRQHQIPSTTNIKIHKPPQFSRLAAKSEPHQTSQNRTHLLTSHRCGKECDPVHDPTFHTLIKQAAELIHLIGRRDDLRTQMTYLCECSEELRLIDGRWVKRGELRSMSGESKTVRALGEEKRW